MDPNAPPPPGATPIPPELEGMLSEMANGVQGLAKEVETQQGAVDQLAQRVLAIEEQQSDLQDSLRNPTGYEAPVPQE